MTTRRLRLIVRLLLTAGQVLAMLLTIASVPSLPSMSVYVGAFAALVLAERWLLNQPPLSARDRTRLEFAVRVGDRRQS